MISGALLGLKREQLLLKVLQLIRLTCFGCSRCLPRPAGAAGDRNQWYSLNLGGFGGSTFGATPLEQPPPLPAQAGAPPQPAAAEPPPQVLRPKPLQASAAVSGGTPQYAGQEQPVTSRSPLAGE